MGKKTVKTASTRDRDLAWDPSTLSGIDVSKNESKAALYLGFDDIGVFRTYQCSHACMAGWLRFDAVRPPKGGLKSGAIFVQLERALSDPIGNFGRTPDELDAKCPIDAAPGESAVQIRNKREKHMAGILYQLVHHHPQWTPDEQKAMAESFQGRLDVKTLPEIETPSIPKWGPFPGDAWGEPYNRALGLLRATMTAWTRWDERLGKSTGLQSMPANIKDLPTFMQTSDDADTGPTVAVREPVAMLEKKTINLYWSDSRPRRDTLEVTYDDVPLPPLTQPAPDIRALSATEWRDGTGCGGCTNSDR